MKTTGQRDHNGWQQRPFLEWRDKDGAICLSVAFSWHFWKAWRRAVWLRAEGCSVRVGGPAVDLNPHPFVGVAERGVCPDAISRWNPNATRTSTGCVNDCAFCAVPITEGELRELTDWDPRPIVCDNNPLACSRKHFDTMIDRLKPLEKVDFNQGLDARRLTPYHAGRLAELDLRCVRLAWDHIGEEAAVHRAFAVLKAAGIKARSIRVYCLIGWRDTPEDALYRLQGVRQLGGYPTPMRFQPLDSSRRNSFVGPNWTHKELARYMRYWSNYFHLGSIPFAEFDREAI